MPNDETINCEMNSDGVYEPDGENAQPNKERVKIIAYSDRNKIEHNMNSFKEGIRTGTTFINDILKQIKSLDSLESE
jgi:hypothetical protein